MRVVECSICKFEWQSRTSANAVDAYHAWLAERLAKAERDKIKNQKIREKNKAKQAAKDAKAASKKKTI
jgi:transcription elongation factor Elf1